MNRPTCHRLVGLEPDNLLAFLALLGLLRVLEEEDQREPVEGRLHPRVGWEGTPRRPVLWLAHDVTQEELLERTAKGVERLAKHHAFGGQMDLDYPRRQARTLLSEAARSSDYHTRYRVDLLAALMSDGAVKDSKDADAAPVDPTPICLLFGGGHQHFLDRLEKVPNQPAPPTRGRGTSAVSLSAADCLAEALFAPWERQDPTFSFRWDPEEATRYALMAGDPTDDTYKVYTQHGANRLAALGLSALTVAPRARGTRVRAVILGGLYKDGEFTFAWPIWSKPITLSAVRGLLGHPGLRQKDGLKHLGVDFVLVAKRIQVARLMNFTRASAE